LSDNKSIINLLPDWLESHVTTGRDPLGMQAGSIMLYQSLLPGISNITLRARYYAFFSFLTHEYANRFHDTSWDNWNHFLRRSEALYALIAANADGYQNGIAGIEWADRTVEANHSGSIDFTSGADYRSKAPVMYLKNKGGAFGGAYAGPMAEIGIIQYSEAHPIPIASKEMGERLAEAFSSSIGEVQSLFLKIIKTGIVTRDELETLSVMLPNRIPNESTEQKLLCSVLFAGMMDNPGRQLDRKNTLQLLLHAADALKSRPTQDDFRWLNYAGKSPDGALFRYPETLHASREFWWIYQTNDLLHIIYERFFSLILTLLAEEPNGVALTAAARAAAKMIAKELGDASWKEYSTSVSPATNANNPKDDDSDYVLTKAICRRPKGVPDQVTSSARAVRLLAILMQRISEHSNALAQTYGKGGKFDRGELQTLYSEQSFLEEHENSSIEQMLNDLLLKRVIYRHQAIALHKLKSQGDYTFLFEIEERRASRRLPYEPVFTNPRVSNALTFLNDLHLIHDEGVSGGSREWMAQ